MKLSKLTATATALGSLIIGAGVLAYASDSNVLTRWNQETPKEVDMSTNLQLRGKRMAPKTTKRQSSFSNVSQNRKAAVPPFASDERAVNIVGCVLDEDAFGMYSYNLSDNGFTLLCDDEDLWINGGGYEHNGVFYGYNITRSSYYGFWCEKVAYDVKTWTKVSQNTAVYYQDTATDLAADPVSGIVYGCFNADNSGTGGFVWAQLNPKNNVRAAIRKLDKAYVAVAVDKSGQFYGIDVDGDLYKIVKESGEQTLVGNTGVDVEVSAQSATFDADNGIMYWAAELSDATTGLYTVDTATGRATLVNKFPGNRIVTGIFVPEKEADFNAPAVPENLTLNFPEGAASGTISFTMPGKTYGGNPLTGSLSYTITCNGETLKTGTANAGAPVSVSSQLPAGYAHVEVSASNDKGNSPKAGQIIYVGIDGPKAVGNLKATAESNTIAISWDAPTESVNGGYFNPASLRYTVTRLPDNKIVAEKQAGTTLQDVIEGDVMMSWSYKVTVYAGDVEGETATSNVVNTGSYCEVPWNVDFSTDEKWGQFTVINSNNDNYTWTWSSSYECAMVDYDFKNPKDDWLISPALNLKGGYTYKLQFMTRTKRALPETLEVKMGKDKTVEAMTEQVMEPTTIKSDDYSKYDIDRVHEYYVTIDEDGKYYLGFHGMSEPQMNRIEIHYINLTEAGITGSPEAVNDLEAVPAADGQLHATVSFTTPANAIGGTPLQSLDRMEIYVNDKLTKTITAPAVNTKLSETVTTVQGNNAIMVKAYNEAGQGLEAKTTVYTGVVKPAPVSNLKAAYRDGKISLTWDAPTVGEEGGYIDPAALTYMVMRNDYSVVAENVSGTEFTDPLTSFNVQGQSIVSYIVYPRNAAGTGYGTYSNGVVLGDAFYTLPYTEGFPYGNMTNTPWGIESDTETSWYTTTKAGDVLPQDNDGGMAMFVPKGQNQSSRIYTGRFNFSKTVHPVVSAWFYKKSECANILEIQVTKDYSTYETIRSINMSDESIPEGWNNAVVELDDYIDAPFVALALRGVSSDSENWKSQIYVDNLQVYDKLDHNLELAEFDAPGSISFGNSGLFGGVVRNLGTKSADNYTVELLCNDRIVAQTNGSPIKPGESVTFQMSVTPAYELAPSAKYKVNINYTEDQNLKNNTSDPRVVLIVVKDYPTVDDLTASATGSGINLSWTAPEPGTAPEVTVEDFESYIPFIIENIGEWTLVDIDGDDGTQGIMYRGSLVEYLNVGRPHAYQVFNPDMAGIGTQTGIDALLPHSGAQYLASLEDTDNESDDWLISPELSGDEQTVSFWVKTPIPNYGFETFEVLYSTTDKDPASFTRIEDVKGEAFISWEEIAVTLPACTKYFAIRHTSKDKLMFAIDDINYIKKGAELVDLVVTGYNIYKDGVKIASVPADATTYTDVLADEDTHEYAVTVQYTQGESGYSNVVNIRNSGVGVITDGVPSVIGAKGCIIIRNAAGQNMSIAAADGKVMMTEAAVEGDRSCRAYPGIYVVTLDDRNYKVYVK